MARKRGGKNNAIRHGAYTEDLLLPGERAEEFERLHQGLIEELKPNGTLEEHTVRAIAENIWRKTRGERFFNWESTWAQENPERGQIDLAHEVLRVLDVAQTEEEARKLINHLPQNYKEYMEIPSRSKFEDHKSWIGSMRSQLLTFVGIHAEILIKRDHDSKFKAEKAAKLRELTGQKIALDERFDAHIDRLIQRLARLKTFKQVVEIQVSQARTIDQRSITDQRQ